jgi:hypothetical protein
VKSLTANSLPVTLKLTPLTVKSLTVAEENPTDEKPNERTEERGDPLAVPGNKGLNV